MSLIEAAVKLNSTYRGKLEIGTVDGAVWTNVTIRDVGHGHLLVSTDKEELVINTENITYVARRIDEDPAADERQDT